MIRGYSEPARAIHLIKYLYAGGNFQGPLLPPAKLGKKLFPLPYLGFALLNLVALPMHTFGLTKHSSIPLGIP